MPVKIKERPPWKYVVFGFFSLGIYDLICLQDILNNLDIVCGYVENSEKDCCPDYQKFVLLTICTLGVYCCICYYRQGKRLKQAAKIYGLSIEEQGSDYVIWFSFGLLMFLMGPYISLYLLTENLKKLNSVYFYQMKWCMEKREYFGNISFSDRTDLDNQRDQPGEVEVKDPSHTSSVLIGTIECIGGDYKGGKITVNSGEELIIGRNSQISQIVLPDMDISRIHCSIRFSQTEHLYYVTDLSSYETTYLNDTIHIKKGQCIPCPLGSKLTLGNGKNQFILK